MRGRLVFLAISAFLVVTSSLNSHFIFKLLLAFWIIRLLCLGQKQLLAGSLVIIGLFGLLSVGKDLGNISRVSPDQGSFLVKVDQNSIQIDGDLLRFQARETETGELLLVSYRIGSEDEKFKLVEESLPQEVLVKGNLEVPGPAKHFDQFDYQKYLYRKGIHWLLRAEELDYRPAQKLPIRFTFFKWIKNVFPGEAGESILLLLFGQQESLSADLRKDFQDLGLVHLLSISGLHISILASIIEEILWRLGLRRDQTSRLLLILLPLYASLVGFGVSVFRAVCQKSLKEVGKLIKLPITSLDAWSLTMLLALALNPYQIFQLAFQLSYGLSFLILSLNQSPWYRASSAMLKNFLLSLIILIFSTPILIHHFYEVSLTSLWTNIFLLPIFSKLVLPFHLALLVLGSVFHKLAFWPILIGWVNKLSQVMQFGISFLAEKLSLYLVLGRLPILLTISLFLLLLAGVYIIEKSSSKAWIKISLLASLCFLILLSKKYSPEGQVQVIDVGQGDAILIKAPYQEKVSLIDTGGRLDFERESWQRRQDPFSISSDVLLPAFKSQAIDGIDQVIISHADTDHMGELEDLARLIPIQRVIIPKQALEDPYAKGVFARLQERGISIQIAKKGDLISIGPTHLQVLSPEANRHYQDKNQASLVLYGKIGMKTWLFTGDIDLAIEKELLEVYPLFEVDVLKVSHHGSRTSTDPDFVKGIQAKWGLISAGENNRYNHPHPEVVDTLEEAGLEIFRTDQDGSIRYMYFFNRERLETAKERVENG